MRQHLPTKAARAIPAFTLLLLTTIALLAGCRFWALQPRTGAVIAGVLLPEVSAPAPPGVTKGELRLRVLWPDRDLGGFRAAAIPLSTNLLVLRISKGSDEIVRKLIPRPADGSPSDVRLELEAASNLAVEVKAYREASPDLATATPIARGTAIVNIRASRTTAQTLRLDALFAPAITALSANAGAVGDIITITGENLGPVQGATPSVTFSGVGASVSAQVTPLGDTKLSVVVPPGAAVGPLVLISDGIPSTSNAAFWVASALKIDVPKAAWDDKPADFRVVLFGTSLQIQSQADWALSPGASVSAYGQPPDPAWSLTNSGAGPISTAGEFTAGNTFAESGLVAKVGSFQSNALELSVQDVQVSLSPATGSLGPAGAASVRFAVVNTFSDGSTNSLGTFSSDDSGKVSVSSSGVAVSGTAAASAYGQVTIRATLKDDPRRSAAATVVLTNVQASTLVGPGAWGSVACFNEPFGAAVDGEGNVYVADTVNHRIRRVAPDGTVTTFAGSGQAGFADGIGLAAKFNAPRGLAIDSAGTLFVADSTSNRIRRIAPDGTVTTVAGSGQAGFANGIGQAAKFNKPRGVAVDAAGTLYVADTDGHRIRKIAPDGTVTTLAGTGQGGFADGAGSIARFNYPTGIAVDGAGNVFVGDRSNFRIRKVAPDGTVMTFAGSGQWGRADGIGSAATFNGPRGVAVDRAGDLYVADTDNHSIRKVARDGTVTTLAGSGLAGFADGAGKAAIFNEPFALAVDGAGYVYIADKENHRIRKLSPDGSVTTLAGTGAPAFADGAGATARFDAPNGVAVDGAGNLYVAEFSKHRIRKVARDGTVTVHAGSGEQGFADGQGAAARFSYPASAVADAVGNTYVADSSNHRIRRIALDGTVTTLAGSGQPGFADGSGATAMFNSPAGVALDAAGNVYVADQNNNRIRKLTPDGTVTTFAGSGEAGLADGTGPSAMFSAPTSLVADAAGNLYVADSGNHRVRKATPDGSVTTLAGSGVQGFADGIGTAAKFSSPAGIALGPAGYVYVADSKNHRLRRVAPDGTVTTLAGSGLAGLSDGLGGIIRFNAPQSLAVDPAGNLCVADRNNNALRKIRLLP